MIKRIIIALVLVGLLLFTAVGCAQETPAATASEPEAATTESNAAEETAESTEEIVVGFSQMDHAGPWRVVETQNLVDVAAERGYKLVYTDAQEQTAKQLSDIEDLVAQGVDYLVIAPRETTGLDRGLEAAKDAGIPVIFIDREYEAEAGVDYATTIASNFIFQGKTCGNALCEALGGKGNVVVIQGTIGGSDARDRQAGFEEALAAYPDVKIIAMQPGDYSRSKAQSVMENFLQANGDSIDAVFCHDDEMAQGAITAIEAAGYKAGEDIKVAGIDGQKSAIQCILDGKMTCVVTSSPYFGDTVFDVIDTLKTGGTVEPFIQLEDYVIDMSNAAEELDKGF